MIQNSECDKKATLVLSIKPIDWQKSKTTFPLILRKHSFQIKVLHISIGTNVFSVVKGPDRDSPALLNMPRHIRMTSVYGTTRPNSGS